MNESKCQLYGMEQFNTIARNFQPMEVNRPNVMSFLTQMSGNHMNMVERYGNSNALSHLFAKEVWRYLVFLAGELATGKEPTECPPALFDEGLERMKCDCMINYPSFRYGKQSTGGALASTSWYAPVTRMFVLHDDNARMIEIPYEEIEGDGTISFEAFTSILLAGGFKVFKEWGYSDEDSNAGAQEMMTILVHEMNMACKTDVVEYLESEGWISKLEGEDA